LKINTIIYEGADRVGKDSLRLAIDKKYDYKYINVVRGPVGYEAYNRMFNKGQDTEAFKETARIMSKFSVALFIRCSEETLARRMRDTREGLRGCKDVEESIRVMMERQRVYWDTFTEASSSWGRLGDGLRNFHVIDNDGTLDEAIERVSQILDRSNGV